MNTLRKTLGFLLQAVTVGLAVAFIIVWLYPDRFGNGDDARREASYADAVARAAPAVVNVHTAKRIPRRTHPLYDDPVARRFFGDSLVQPEHTEASLGSGVILSADGYVMTNDHVIADADEIQVALHDGRIAAAEVVGSDPETDLALLRIELDDLPTITVGRADGLRVGDVVLAIGNPYGFGQTVTQGIISATGRSYLNLATFENFIQTDAAINPGNSGGALINAAGELIGINTAFYTRAGGSQGIGFAIPVDLARGVMEHLAEHGRVIRGWLGVTPQDLTPDLAEVLDVRGDTRGVIVANVLPDSPASAAGLRAGDIITHIDGVAVTNGREALNRIAAIHPGSVADITVLRDGGELTIEATVGERSN